MTDPHLADFESVKEAIASQKCRHLGKPLGTEQASLLGLGTLRTWRPCSKGHGEKNRPAGYVACCNSSTVCTSSCPDYISVR